MSITIETTTIAGRFSVNLPDGIPVPAVAKAAAELKEAEADLQEARRDRDATAKAVRVAEDAIAFQAAALKVKKKKVGAAILEQRRDARDAAELAQINVAATERAFEHNYAVLVAVFEANRVELEEAALKDAYTALQRLAAAKLAFDSAAVAATASYGILGMLWNNEHTGARKLVIRDRDGSNRDLFTQEATSAIAKALRRNALEYEAHKRGDAPSKKELEAATDGED